MQVNVPILVKAALLVGSGVILVYAAGFLAVEVPRYLRDVLRLRTLTKHLGARTVSELDRALHEVPGGAYPALSQFDVRNQEESDREQAQIREKLMCALQAQHAEAAGVAAVAQEPVARPESGREFAAFARRRTSFVPRHRPEIQVFPKFRPDWKAFHHGNSLGECLDYPLQDLFFFDLDRKADIGDLVLLRNRATGALSMKYLFEYNGRVIMASKHPPVPMHYGIELMGPAVLRVSPGSSPRQSSPEFPAIIDAEREASSAVGYGSPRWFIDTLGKFPPRSARVSPTDKRCVRKFTPQDLAYAINPYQGSPRRG